MSKLLCNQSKRCDVAQCIGNDHFFAIDDASIKFQSMSENPKRRRGACVTSACVEVLSSLVELENIYCESHSIRMRVREWEHCAQLRSLNNAYI